MGIDTTRFLEARVVTVQTGQEDMEPGRGTAGSRRERQGGPGQDGGVEEGDRSIAQLLGKSCSPCPKKGSLWESLRNNQAPGWCSPRGSLWEDGTGIRHTPTKSLATL